MLYLDANAGRAVLPAALDAYLEASQLYWANPSSSHALGCAAARCLAVARARIGRGLGLDPNGLVFTSGGTEADALALAAVFALPARPTKPHVVTTALEHPAVGKTLQAWHDAERIDLSVVAAGRSGRIEIEALLAALRPETRLLSCMLASNETGVIQPVDALSAHLKACGRLWGEQGARPDALLLHSDVVQAVGKVPLPSVSLLSFSGHKLGAVGGIGALWRRHDIPLSPLIVGGGQEHGVRGGTENVAGAVSLAVAVEHAVAARSEHQAVACSREALEAALEDRFDDGVEIVGRAEARLPGTSLIRFPGCDGEALMMSLDVDGIAVSTGSACSSGVVEASKSLVAMGYTPSEALQVIRISFATPLAPETIDRLVRQLGALVERLTGRAC